MKKTKTTILLIFSCLTVFGQTNSYPPTGNVNIFQPSGSYRSYDVTNFNSNIVSRFEATTDGTGQLWLRDAAGNYKVAIRSHTTYPSIIAGELILGNYTLTSKNRKLYVDGTSEFVGNLYGRSNFLLKQVSGSARAYDVENFNGNIVSRFEATTDGSGQLWFKDAGGNYKVVIRGKASAPSAIAGELIIGKYSITSENRKLFVEGTSEFTGNLYGRSNFLLKQASGSARAYDVENFNGNIVSRFEATTDGSGQLWFKDAAGNYKVVIRGKASAPSAIAGELVIGEYVTSSKGKKLFVKGDSWIEGQLGVDGKIRGEEVKVEIINGPDYVFEPDYELRTLKETKEFITENKHLPEIPPAREMEANGVDLGDMNMRLLKKIEELTLYQIELLERLEQLESKNAEIDELQKKIEVLENK